jgi:hypothetical protein
VCSKLIFFDFSTSHGRIELYDNCDDSRHDLQWVGGETFPKLVSPAVPCTARERFKAIMKQRSLSARVFATLFALVLFLLDIGQCKGEEWPEFRGPTGQGISAATDLPVTWDATTNVAWRADIAGKGWSSPVVYRDRIYLTTAVPLTAEEDSARSLRVVCLDATTGKDIWQREVFVQPATPVTAAGDRRSPAVSR